MVELLAYAEHPLVSLGNLELIAFMGTKIYKKQTNEQNSRHFKRCNKDLLPREVLLCSLISMQSIFIC